MHHNDQDQTLSFASPIKPTASTESAMGYRGPTATARGVSPGRRRSGSSSHAELVEDSANQWLDQQQILQESHGTMDL